MGGWSKSQSFDYEIYGRTPGSQTQASLPSTNVAMGMPPESVHSSVHLFWADTSLRWSEQYDSNTFIVDWNM